MVILLLSVQADTAPAPVTPDRHEKLSVSSVAQIDQDEHPPFAFDLVAGSTGKVYLFASAPPVRDAMTGTTIEAYALGKESIDSVPGITTKARVKGLIARAGPKGRITLLWREEYAGERPFEDVLRRAEMNDGQWLAQETVSDADAQPHPFSRGTMDLLVDDSGRLDVFWSDFRESHFSLIESMDFAKTYQRSRLGNEWSPARRVQPRGRFDADALSVVEDADGVVHLFWGQSGGWRPYSDVFHATRVNGKVGKPERVTENRDYDGTVPAYVEPSSASGPRSTILLSWMWQRWASKSVSESLLEVRTWSSGVWSEDSITVSRRAQWSEWCTGPGGTTGLLLQEYTTQRPPVQADRGGHTLSFIRVDDIKGPMVSPLKAEIGSNTIDGQIACTVSPDGVTHIAI